ncbi:MAG: hypothetical protein ACLU7P_02645 [Eggerthella lenta]
MVGKKQLGKIIDKCITKHGFTKSGYAGRHHDLGYHYPPSAPDRRHRRYDGAPEEVRSGSRTRKEITKIDRQYRRGLITNDERYRLSVQAWEKTTADVTSALQESMTAITPST